MSSEYVCSLNYQESNAQAQNHIFAPDLPVSITLFQLSQQAHLFERDVNKRNLYVMKVSKNLIKTIKIQRSKKDITKNVSSPS
jgi:hypothetical protein